MGAHFISEVDLQFGGTVYLAEVLAKGRRLGYKFAEIESPMIARIKGVTTISKPRAIWRTFGDLWRLWWRLRTYSPALAPEQAPSDTSLK